MTGKWIPFDEWIERHRPKMTLAEEKKFSLAYKSNPKTMMLGWLEMVTMIDKMDAPWHPG